MPRTITSSDRVEWRRAEWLAARALLTSQRLRPLLPVALAVFVVVFAAVFAARGPLASRALRAERTAGRGAVSAPDTLPLVAAVERAREQLVNNDSVERAAPRPLAERTATPVLSASATTERDSLRTMLAQLDAALDRAAKAPLTASYRALATTPALRTINSVQLLADTLDLLERARRSLDPAAAPQSEFAQLSQRANSIGADLQAIGQSRRTFLQQRLKSFEVSALAGDSNVTAVDSTHRQAVRDSVLRQVAVAESALRDARTQYRLAEERADSAAQQRARRILGASPLAAALSTLLMVIVMVFTVALIAEARHPTLAHAREAERLTGLPVLASAEGFRVRKDGRARLEPGTGLDPLRMLYLSLTASGTRHRVVGITGDDAAVTVAAAGRLAVCAASDERATLVVDLASGRSSTAAYFGWREEPGFTEAIAGVRLWREVARPTGASDGLVMDVIPPGMPRSDTAASVADAAARREFATFLGEYDFSVVVASTPAALASISVLESPPPIVVVARLAQTRTQALVAMLSELRKSQLPVHGLVMIRQ